MLSSSLLSPDNISHPVSQLLLNPLESKETWNNDGIVLY